jgi:hypothetical protein
MSHPHGDSWLPAGVRNPSNTTIAEPLLVSCGACAAVRHHPPQYLEQCDAQSAPVILLQSIRSQRKGLQTYVWPRERLQPEDCGARDPVAMPFVGIAWDPKRRRGTWKSGGGINRGYIALNHFSR